MTFHSKHHQIVIVFFAIIAIVSGCRDRFEADIELQDTGFLVVEGYINIGERAVTTLYLSRTVPVDQSNNKIDESNASVFIESDHGEMFSLYEVTPGTYVSDSLNLLVMTTYRIRISIADKIYLSEFVTPIETPAIDSVSWHQQVNGEVVIGVSTHDNTGEIQLYQWEYDEVWEIDPPFTSPYDYVGGTTWVNRSANEIKNMQTCWKYRSSLGFNTVSTKAQVQNLILNNPIKAIPKDDERLDVRYSILVRQHALSNEAYNYIQLILKNSESLGTFFDPLPGQLTGNIYCTSSSEPVIGIIGAYTTKSTRIFIYNDDVPSWNYTTGCQDTLTMYGQDLSTVMKSNSAVRFHYTQPLIADGVYITANYCADCRIHGGTNIRPSFWEY